MFAPYIIKKFKLIPTFAHVAICPWKLIQPKDKIKDIDGLLKNSDSQYIAVPELAVVNGKSALIKFFETCGRQ